jgi:hypothetical protein
MLCEMGLDFIRPDTVSAGLTYQQLDTIKVMNVSPNGYDEVVGGGHNGRLDDDLDVLSLKDGACSCRRLVKGFSRRSVVVFIQPYHRCCPDVDGASA